MTECSQGNAHPESASINALRVAGNGLATGLSQPRSTGLLHARTEHTHWYRGTTRDVPRRGHGTFPRLLSDKVGHQCRHVHPFHVAQLGGIDVACRETCQGTLDLGERAYAGVPAWNNRKDWIGAVEAAYKRLYLLLRPQLDRGIALPTLLGVAQIMADAADGRTGRNSRLSRATIAGRFHQQHGRPIHTRTVARALNLLRLLGVATEIFRGRQRSRNERFASWKRGDRSRGWASVYGLHPSIHPALRPVDNTRDDQGNLLQSAPHPVRASFSSPSRFIPNFRTKRNNSNEGASRRNDKQRVDRGAPAYVLASQWLAERRTPRWAHRHTATYWSRALRRIAEHGWNSHDINVTIDTWARTTGISPTPHEPGRWLRYLLYRWNTDIETPPHVHEQAARDIAARERRELLAARDARLHAAETARATARTALTGPGRRAVQQILDARVPRHGKSRGNPTAR